ncbi:MAG: ABC transporter permease [Pirellulaceae bacterium]|jgi:tungstate transport system permease protein|nr:ABC transporter permease [Pirellulaceae bacterium]
MFDDVLRNAWHLVVTFDPDVFGYAVRSLTIATVSTLVAGVVGIPAGILIGQHDFAGKRAVVTILNTLLALPTVVVGLTVYMFVSRQGPLGHLELLFTVPGIIIGEVLLIIPLITALTVAAMSRTGRDVRKTALALGASSRRAHWTVICESRFGILAAIIAAFGRVVSEVGVATILGGNIDRFTRTMTTALVRYVDMGEFALALALGMLLLTISLSINILFQFVQGGGQE